MVNHDLKHGQVNHHLKLIKSDQALKNSNQTCSLTLAQPSLFVLELWIRTKTKTDQLSWIRDWGLFPYRKIQSSNLIFQHGRQGGAEDGDICIFLCGGGVVCCMRHWLLLNNLLIFHLLFRAGWLSCGLCKEHDMTWHLIFYQYSVLEYHQHWFFPPCRIEPCHLMSSDVRISHIC